MNAEQKTAKIIAAIAGRGWASVEVSWNEAQALKDAGVIKMEEKFTTGGNRKMVWVAA